MTPEEKQKRYLCYYCKKYSYYTFNDIEIDDEDYCVSCQHCGKYEDVSEKDYIELYDNE